jgi:hypothetical protein
MTHLKSIADELKRHGTLEGMCTACYTKIRVDFSPPFTAMRQTMFSDAQSQLKSAEILPGCRYHKRGVVMLRELLKKESISSTDYDKLDFVTGDKLLEANIVAYHHNSGKVTFQSTVMKRFCEENLALWERK